ncbi:endonuclease V [Myxococcus xanthus DK 1622]|uniref:Endonuclease V n=1 Tax=Myxococcus xanthus (strain DK1622) TaxID=246197 RepID=NFI_MYXXD|nr:MULTISPECIES: deoxyribonuclease V [Myxococcus]Q1DC68.1 RecName: Full=Endonuclease V; AltName: Full=Deoxyinosine 3'endonuclease; AltName: Full=Deoxyribonuclease V; Short=DNase V [Myxococcus xanthus DK 1622]ABF87431.1 endonuclease V [Myxococcus xanthus DK 1622]QPM81133.1 endonuclease V [Myxococcus xanthus]QVW70192.1 endonuclease V [Myxococcus xanthus DZ2]UEO03678.1 deoxyribonuclease V [Myxococcus xanthus DZ2]UYI16135.1 deoxyribonuclease V [Myxococcus xanthus]
MCMALQPEVSRWDVTPSEAVELQRRLREQLVLRPPPGLKVERIAGADISTEKGKDTGFGGFVVLDVETLAPVAQSEAVVTLHFPYVPGLLSFRELPTIAAAWERLTVRPDVVIFDGQGTAHPRRMGIACHGGLLFGVPSIGCAKSLLVGTHGPLGEARGSTAPLMHRGEVVGMAVRTRKGVQPVYVSPGHLMDLPTAVEWVLKVSPKYREPETTRHAHRLVNALRRADGEAAELE